MLDIKVINSIKRKKKVFDDLKILALHERDENAQLKLIEIASLWAINMGIGKYSDKEIEKKLCSVAKQHYVQQHEYISGSFLHVATSVFSTGGHTRLIDNWIVNSDAKEKHSLALTDQLDNEIPGWLKKSIENKSGDIYKINKNDYVQNALSLRKLASKYEYVILYTHMHDIRPLIAFGTECFHRPIIFYNHADHIFWLGISLADMLIELSNDGKTFSLINRGKVNSEVLPIPVNCNHCYIDKDKSIQLVDKTFKGKKIIVSMASTYKYKACENYDFISTAKKILKDNPNAYFIVIGPNKFNQLEWQDAFKETEGRLNAIGYKQREEVELYKAIADIYIDSFPYHSYTSMLEFASSGVPVLILRTPGSKIDVMYKKEVLCSNSDELVKKTSVILHSPEEVVKYNIQKDVKALSNDDKWKLKKDKIVESVPKIHKIHFNFSNISEISEYDIFTEQKMFDNIFWPFSKKISMILNIKILIILFFNKKIDMKMIRLLFNAILKYNKKLEN